VQAVAAQIIVAFRVQGRSPALQDPGSTD
jgi:hypothetical protein